MVDTPGYGDAIDNSDSFQQIIRYIDDQFERSVLLSGTERSLSWVHNFTSFCCRISLIQKLCISSHSAILITPKSCYIYLYPPRLVELCYMTWAGKLPLSLRNEHDITFFFSGVRRDQVLRLLICSELHQGGVNYHFFFSIWFVCLQKTCLTFCSRHF